MSTTTMPTTSAPSATPRSVPPADLLADLYRMTVDEYERLAEADVLAERRVELIGGYLVRKMTTKPPHAWAVDAARERLERVVPSGWDVREEKPVRIPDFDEPEPDLAVVAGTRDDYCHRHPGSGDIALLVEVADSSLGWDRGAKRDAYARGGVPVYWIVNLIDRQVEVHSSPGPDGYQNRHVHQPGDELPVVVAGVEAGRIAVADILPPAAIS